MIVVFELSLREGVQYKLIWHSAHWFLLLHAVIFVSELGGTLILEGGGCCSGSKKQVEHVKDLQTDTARWLVFVVHYFFCFSCVFPTLKKKEPTKAPLSLRLGWTLLFMHEYYINIYKLQDEIYLYRWRRGGETKGRGTPLGFGFIIIQPINILFTSMCLLCLWLYPM